MRSCIRTAITISSTIFIATAIRAEMGLPEDTGTTPRQVGISTPAPVGTDNATESKALDGKWGDSLEFLNGDKLHGTMTGVSPDSHGLKWTHPDAESPIAFNLSRLSSATLARRPGPKSAACNAVVRLTNGA